MFSLENLPTEITTHIFLALDDPSDLLHIALTCTSFYEMIVPTYHLDLVSISCCDLETPPEFWQTLSTSHHYASMIRHLELADEPPPKFRSSRAQRQLFLGRRIDEEFAKKFSSNSLQPVSGTFSSQEFFLRSLAYMDGLKSFSITGQTRENACDCLRHVSNYFSNSLEILHVHHGGLPHTFSQYKSSDFSFHCLTSFSLDINTTATFPEQSGLLLNSLSSDCHTMVNFALHTPKLSPILQLMKDATWPSLKKLTLSLTAFQLLVDRLPPREEDIELYLTFFARHPRLERLYLMLQLDHTRQFLDELSWRLAPVLPSVLSLYCTFPIPPDILPRLVHASTWNFWPIDHYPLAQSLRSLFIRSTVDFDGIRAIAEAMPQLERLSVTIKVLQLPEEIASFSIKLPRVMSPLINLTHLQIHLDWGSYVSIAVPCYPDRFLKYLPSLTYFRFWDYNDGWSRAIRKNSSSTYRIHSLKKSSDRSFELDFWGDLFMGPSMRV